MLAGNIAPEEGSPVTQLLHLLVVYFARAVFPLSITPMGENYEIRGGLFWFRTDFTADRH